MKTDTQTKNCIRVLFMLLVGLTSYWQIANSNNGIDLLAVAPFSDAYLYHYSAWFKATLSNQGHLSSVLAFSPYELLLTSSIKLFGHSNLTPFIVNATLSAFTCLLLINSTFSLFNKKIAIVCATFYLFCSPILFFSGTTLKTNLVLFLAALSYWSAINFYISKKAYWVILFTVAIMICAVDRIHILLVLLIFLYILISTKEIPGIRAKKNYLLASVICIVMLYGFSVYKYQAEPGYLSPIGLNIFLGHSKPDNWTLNVVGIRNNIIGHREDAKKVAENETKRILTNNEVTIFWLQKTWSYIKANPRQYLKAQSQKIMQLLSPAPYSTQESYQHWRSKKLPLALTFIDFSIIFPLFLLGAILLTKKQKQLSSKHYFSILSGVFYLLSIMSTIVIERYRVTAMIFMLPIASYATIQFFEKKIRVRLSFVCMILIYLCSHTFGAIMNRNKSDDWYAKRKTTETMLRQQQIDWFTLREDLGTETLIRERCYKIQVGLTKINYHRDLKALSTACSRLN